MFLVLNRTALDNGRAIGQASRAVLRERIRATRTIAARQRIPDRLVAARVRDFARHLRKVARHWLDEAAGLAEGCGASVDDTLALNYQRADRLYRAHGCGVHLLERLHAFERRAAIEADYSRACREALDLLASP